MIGSASMPSSESTLVAVASTRSRNASPSSRTAAGGGAKVRRSDSGARSAARRVDRQVRRFPEPRDARRRPGPIGEPLLPQCRLLLRRTAAASIPGLRLPAGRPTAGSPPAADSGKVQQQVAQVALGVDGNDRDVVDQRLLEQADAQSGLAAAGHADDDRVCRQVLGVIQDQFVGALAGREVLDPAEIEGAKLFEVFHATRVRRGSTAGIRTLNTA